MTSDPTVSIRALAAALQGIAEALESLAPADRQRQDAYAQKLRAIRVAKTELLSWLQEQSW